MMEIDRLSFSIDPDSLLPEQSAQLHQVADAELAVAVLVEHRAQQSTAESALLADLLLLLAEQAAKRLGTAGLLRCATGQGALGEVGHHDRRQHLQQLAGLALAEAGGLGDAGFRARLPAAEDVAEDAGAVVLPGLAAAEHGAEHAADIHAGMVLLQRAEQRLRALRLAGVPAERAHDEGQGSADRGRGLFLADAELLCELAGGRALELGGEVVGERGHGGTPVVGTLDGTRRALRRGRRQSSGGPSMRRPQSSTWLDARRRSTSFRHEGTSGSSSAAPSCTGSSTRSASRRISLRSGHAGQGRSSRTRASRSEEHTSELQSRENLVCRLLL